MVANSANDLPPNMKTTAVISQNGGASKTTVGIHFAVAAGLPGMNSALFDLDPQAPRLQGCWPREDGQHGSALLARKALLARLASSAACLAWRSSSSARWHSKTRPSWVR
jgi:hypothetical protein